MKNVTVALPEDLARWLRVRAAEEDRSVSKWLGERIASWKREEDAYQLAMERCLAAEPVDLKEPGEHYPTRESLYDRAGLR